MGQKEAALMVVGGIIGWLLCLGWHGLTDWIADALDISTGAMWDVCAVIGLCVIAGGIIWSFAQ